MVLGKVEAVSTVKHWASANPNCKGLAHVHSTIFAQQNGRAACYTMGKQKLRSPVSRLRLLLPHLLRPVEELSPKTAICHACSAGQIVDWPELDVEATNPLNPLAAAYSCRHRAMRSRGS